MTDRTLRRAGVVLALLGLAVAGYLTYVHYADVPVACSFSHGCAKVQSSAWSKLAGVPVAVVGLAGYAAILAAFVARGENARLAAALFALVGAGYSAYLTWREVFTIEAICQWCVASALLMTALAVVTMARVLRGPDAAEARYVG